MERNPGGLHELGFGASGRSGGQVNPMLPVARPSELRSAVADKYFDRLADVSLGSADELFDLVRRYEIEADARQRGWLRVDHNEAAMEVMTSLPKPDLTGVYEGLGLPSDIAADLAAGMNQDMATAILRLYRSAGEDELEAAAATAPGRGCTRSD